MHDEVLNKDNYSARTYHCFPQPFFRFNVSPSATIELLNRMAKAITLTPQQCLFFVQVHCFQVFKDYCGILTEESIRKNFILVYELLDEMVDFGYPQVTSTEMLKSCVHNEAVLVKAPSALAAASSMLSMSKNKTKVIHWHSKIVLHIHKNFLLLAYEYFFFFFFFFALVF